MPHEHKHSEDDPSEHDHSEHDHSEHHSSMAKRGVTRPQMHRHKDDGGDTEMSHQQRLEMQQKHHEQTLWVPLTIIMLGVWLLSTPITFGYGSGVGEAIARSAERNMFGWGVIERALAMAWSDTISGLLLIALGSLWFIAPRYAVVPWAACFVGIWLQFAPLIFWAPDAAAYITDTLIGAWVIALTILIPGMPPMIMIMKMGPQTPPGWSYNPSSWMQRAPLAITGFVGWLISRYLAAYQLGYIENVWDPFFGESTAGVLTSKVSESWPISDAGMGAFAYTFETLMAFMGGVSRWRTMPWMVLFFGILVIPLGLVHIVLVIMQPVVVGHWCTLCIAAALVMLVMIPLSVDEVVAMGQFVLGRVRDGDAFWRVFWKGGTPSMQMQKDERTPHYKASPAKTIPSMVWGVSFPWTLLLSTLIGVWLMFAPSVFGISGAAADSNHLAGAILVTNSVIVMAEVLRSGRYLNTLLGAWIALSPWILSGISPIALGHNLVCGIAIIALSLPKGPIKERYGGWERFIF